MMKTLYIKLLLLFVLGTTAVFLLTSQQGKAAEETPEQQRLQSIQLSEAAEILIQDTFIPNAGDNGFVNEDGQDIIQNYLSGVRADYMIPLAMQPSLSKEAANELARQGVRAYVASFVYRFADAAAASAELERLRQTPFAGLIAIQEKSQNPPTLVFTFDGSTDAPLATTNWLLIQQDAFLTVVILPGMFHAPSFLPFASQEVALQPQSSLELEAEAAMPEAFILAYNEATTALLTAVSDSLTFPSAD